MVPGINPKVDYVFKILFGSETNVFLLINLLNAILRRRPDERIVWVEILNPFNEKETLDDKLSIVDIKARDQLGRRYNIEMQLVAGPDFQRRILYYWAVLYSGQLSEGEDYFNLRETISICFVNNVLYPDVVNGETLDAENLPRALHFPEVEKAMEVLKVVSQNDIERERYQARLKAQRDHDSLVRYGPREYQRGIDIGHSEGRSEGIEIGRSEGIEIGRSEGIEKGKLVGRIHLCQKLRKLPSTPTDELLSLSVAELRTRAETLENQLGVNADEA